MKNYIIIVINRMHLLNICGKSYLLSYEFDTYFFNIVSVHSFFGLFCNDVSSASYCLNFASKSLEHHQEITFNHHV